MSFSLLNYIGNNINIVVAIFTVVIAVISLVVSLYSVNLSRSDFNASHRPYVFVENHGYLNENNIIIHDVYTVQLLVQNNPAKMISEKYEYYIIEDGKFKKRLDIQEYSGKILYPHEKLQLTRSVGINLLPIGKLKQNQELRRKIRIDYEWLSTKKRYYFEGVWRYNNGWEEISQNAS